MEDGNILELQYGDGKTRLPVLVIGNKVDLVPQSKKIFVVEEDGTQPVEMARSTASLCVLTTSAR